jgi:uncharacterized membrane protein YccC
MLIKRFDFLLHPTGKIEVSRGIRTFFALAIPIAIGYAIGQPDLGWNIGSSAQLLLFADVGGLYSIRAKSLVGSTLGIMLAIALGTLISGSLGLTVIVVFVGLFLAGYLTVYGENGAFAGLVISLSLLIAITLPTGGWDIVVERVWIALLGSSWAIFLALGIWPFQPNTPLLQIVARNFQGIAGYLRNFSSFSAFDQEERPASSQPRQLLLESRKLLTYTRVGRWGKSELRELLIVLIEDSDRILTTIISIQELLRIYPLPQLTTVSILLDDVRDQVAGILEDIGQLILGKAKIPDCDRLKLLIKAVEQQQILQRKTLETDIENYASYAAVEQIKTWLSKLQQQLYLASQTAQQLHDRNQWQSPSKKLKRSPTEKELWIASEKSWWEPLAENFNLESPLFRHALRLGLGAALGVLIYTFAHISQGLWIGFTLVIVLKPDFSLTFQRLFLRIIGTVLGLLAVYFLLILIHPPLLLEIIGIFSMAIALSLIRFHYSLAVFFITIFAVILSEVQATLPNVDFITARLVGTLIGGAIAFILSFSVLRMKEELRFSSALIQSISEMTVYFQSVMDVYLGQTAYDPVTLTRNRHEIRLTNTKMQAALQRLLDDPSTPFATMEPAITLTNYIPRFGRGITVLLTQLEQHTGSEPHPNLALFTDQVTQSLTQFAQALQENTPLLPLPEINQTMQNILNHLQDLQEERLTEIANHQHNTTTHQYLRDYNIVATELQEMVFRLEAIHEALSRFQSIS